MRVTWDPAKARANQRKHGIHFADAEIALRDPLALTLVDNDAVEGDRRFVSIGKDALDRLVVLVYSYEAETIRLISARNATKRERRFYEERVRFFTREARPDYSAGKEIQDHHLPG
ncbi:MAG: BrnT family toxin [Chromatiales bacterium]|nr:MAG: BrnT family toxin [Chromatiales bacterium]